MSAVLLSHGSGIEQETDDYHKIYARNAKPYANLVYDKSLPFVPRYRYGENLKQHHEISIAIT